MEQSKLYQIKNITEHEYTLVGCDGSVITRPIQDVDKSASVFTIEDAKDGDVLVSVGNQPFIYNGKYTDSVVGAYIGIDFDGVNLFATKTNNWTMTKGVKPATKEERDLLFQRMKEEGYEWNAEKKELKKQ